MGMRSVHVGGQLGLIVAFVAGILSCASPCVAPLIPGYLALLSGAGGAQARTTRGPDWRLLRTSALFVAGFTLVFVTLGVSAATFGGLLDAHRRQLARASGVVMLLMGVAMLGLFRLPGLLRERRWHPEPHTFRASETLLLGMAFGFGWTPCFGPVLAVILAYSSSAATVRHGAALLFAYALGLGLPFLLLGAGASWFERWSRGLRRYAGAMSAASGLVLIAIGWLFVTERFFYLSIATQRLYYSLMGG